MTGEQRVEVLAQRLPLAWQEGPAVRVLLGALAAELGVAEQGLLRLVRSRHLWGAEGWSTADAPADHATSDLGRLAQLLGLSPQPGERDRAFRQRVQRVMAVHRAGLGTAEAILRLAALAVGSAEEPALERVVEVGEAITRARVLVRTAAGHRATLTLELHDNPPQVADAEGAIGPEAPLTLRNRGVLPAPLQLELRADAALRCPTLLDPTRGVLLVYAGELSAGQALHLDAGGPELLGAGVPAPLFALRGDWLGRPDRVWGQATPAEPLPLAEALTLPTGPSAWTLVEPSPGVAAALLRAAGLPVPEGWADRDVAAEDRAWFEALPREALLDEPACALAADEDSPGALLAPEPPGAGEPPTPPPARGVLRARWVEREAACFALHVIAGALPAAAPDEAALLAALRGAIQYGRAAGIRGRVRWVYTLDAEAPPLPELRLRGVGLRAREDLAPEARGGMQVRVALRDALRVPEAQHEAETARFNRTRLGYSLLAEAPELVLDEGRLSRSALAEATPLALDAGLLGAHTLASATPLALDLGLLGREVLAEREGSTAPPRTRADLDLRDDLGAELLPDLPPDEG